jgi:hypothetical protein
MIARARACPEGAAAEWWCYLSVPGAFQPLYFATGKRFQELRNGRADVARTLEAPRIGNDSGRAALLGDEVARKRPQQDVVSLGIA